MGAGISVRNESEISILVIASQLTPLHWGRCDPGQTWNEHNQNKMGKVWFTVSISHFDERNEPTAASVAARLATLTAAAIGTGLVGFAVVGLLSGVTSIQGTKLDGVYADNKCIVVKGFDDGNGTYKLYISEIEQLGKDGSVVSVKQTAEKIMYDSAS